MRKRFLAILLALTMALTLLVPAALAEDTAALAGDTAPLAEDSAPLVEDTTALAEDSTALAEDTMPLAETTPTSGKCGDNVTWFLNKDGTLVLNGSGATYDYGESGWDEIPTPWYDLTDQITYIKIQGKITRLGSSLFDRCGKVRGISIPHTLESIGRLALPDQRYRSLQYFIGDGLGGKITVRDHALYGDWGDTLIMYPPALKTSSGTYTMPNHVTRICENAFYCNSYLEKVVLTDGIKEIPSGAFERCTNLKEIVIPSSVTKIDNAFTRCINLSKLEIPSSVTQLDLCAFWYCDKLDSIVIPASVRSVTAGWTPPDGVGVDYSKHKDFIFCGDAPTLELNGVPSMEFNDGWANIIRTDIYYPSDAVGWAVAIKQFANNEDVRFIPYDRNSDGQLHGKISVSAVYNPSGEKVTLSVTPDPGYRLSSIEVTDGEGNRKVQVSGSGNTYTFFMPAYDVTVRAKFIKN